MIDDGEKKERINHKEIDKNAVVDKQVRMFARKKTDILESIAVQSLTELNNAVPNGVESVKLVRQLAILDPQELRNILLHFSKSMSEQISACLGSGVVF